MLALLTGVDEELVGEARVVHVVDGRGEQRREHLQAGEDRLQRRRVEQHVRRLHHVGRVHPVVVRRVLQVVVLQRHHERDECLRTHLERL